MYKHTHTYPKQASDLQNWYSVFHHYVWYLPLVAHGNVEACTTDGVCVQNHPCLKEYKHTRSCTAILIKTLHFIQPFFLLCKFSFIQVGSIEVLDTKSVNWSLSKTNQVQWTTSYLLLEPYFSYFDHIPNLICDLTPKLYQKSLKLCSVTNLNSFFFRVRASSRTSVYVK